MKKIILLVSILLASASAALSQQLQPVQFFPSGYVTNFDYDDSTLWKYADSIIINRNYINDLIKKIERHFVFDQNVGLAGICGLNEYLIFKVYNAYEDTIRSLGLKFEDENYFPEVNALFDDFINKLLDGHKLDFHRDSMWNSEIPLSVILNDVEKHKVLDLLKTQQLYSLSLDIQLSKINNVYISYGSEPASGSIYYHFFNEKLQSGDLVFSVQEKSTVDAFSPNKIRTDTLQKEYKILLDTLKNVYVNYFDLEAAQKYTLSAPESNVKVSSMYSVDPYFNYWFSVLFYNNKPQCFMTGYPVAILKIDNKRFWIFEIKTPDIGLYGFQFYTEENDSLKLYFESYLFSI